MCIAVPVNAAEEAEEKIRQASMFKDREKPGVIDTGINSSKVSQKNTRVLWSTRDVGQKKKNSISKILSVICLVQMHL